MTQRPSSRLWLKALAIVALIMNFALPGELRAGTASPSACTVDQLNAAVDAAATELRTFSAEAQPKLKQQLASLRDKYKWPEDGYEDRALEHLQDGKLSMLDTQANELLTRIDTLGRPEENPGTDTCAAVNEVKAAVSELLSVMREKANYISVKVNAELGTPAVAAAPPPTATLAAAAPQPAPPAPQKQPTTTPAPTPKGSEASSSVVSTVATAKGQPTASTAAAPTPAPAPASAPSPEKIAKADPVPPQAAKTPPLPPAPQAQQQIAAKTKPAPLPPAPPPEQSWQTSPSAPQPAGDPEPYPSPDGTYAAREGEAYPAGSEPYGPPPDQAPSDDGYTIEEIRNATKGFFGTISTSLASVIEHAFKKSGRPTAYILGNEGGGAFLAGLRYGEGTMYLRSGGTQKVYWHGPSIGSDVGADGSRTLFLIYHLNEPNDLYRQFSGIDGTAYLVGGVGLTFLKGGPVVMAPIRSGLGLRFGASLGYLRFTSHKTWNPF